MAGGGEMNIGCETCGLNGKECSCWGDTHCHGYYSGCGCKECTERERRENEKQNNFGPFLDKCLNCPTYNGLLLGVDRGKQCPDCPYFG